MDNFFDNSTETTLHEICVQVFLRFSDSSKPSQSISLIYEFVWLAGFRKLEENLLKTLWKVVPVIKLAHIFWWRHNNRKQSASAREHWCEISCDIPYCMIRHDMKGRSQSCIVLERCTFGEASRMQLILFLCVFISDGALIWGRCQKFVFVLIIMRIWRVRRLLSGTWEWF